MITTREARAVTGPWGRGDFAFMQWRIEEDINRDRLMGPTRAGVRKAVVALCEVRRRLPIRPNELAWVGATAPLRALLQRHLSIVLRWTCPSRAARRVYFAVYRLRAAHRAWAALTHHRRAHIGQVNARTARAAIRLLDISQEVQ